MITLENYESYLFLYHEGELDSTACTEVERFLLEHPDIREEMEAYYDPTLVVTAQPPATSVRRHPLWVWAAAACLAAVLVSGAFLFISPAEGDGSTLAVATPSQPLTEVLPAQDSPAIQTAQPSLPMQVQRRQSHAPQAVAKAETDYRPAASLAATVAETMPVEDNLIAQEAHLPMPEVVECQQIAEVRDLVLVDNLALEVPNATETRQPLIVHLAMNFRRNLANTRQNIRDFLRYELFSDTSYDQLAQANISQDE